MSQRFSLFYAGFTSAAPALYFQKKCILETYLNQNGNATQTSFQEFYDKLKDDEDENNSLITTSNSIANYFGFNIVSQPIAASDYVRWFAQYNSLFESQFPITRIDYYYYVYAQKIADVLTNIGLLKLHLELPLYKEENEERCKQLDNYLNQIHNALYKMTAPSTLLAGEPRQNHFRLYYHEMNLRYEKIKNRDCEKLNEADIRKLQIDLEDFRCLVINGFKKCILLLKKLGI
jgi:hypothetical protein